jgi:hypothetical protein
MAQTPTKYELASTSKKALSLEMPAQVAGISGLMPPVGPERRFAATQEYV